MFCLLFVSLFKWQLFTFSLEVCRRGDGFTDGTRDKRGLGFTETCSLCYITLFLFRYRNILLSKKHAWTTGHVVRLDYNLFIKNNTDSELKSLDQVEGISKGNLNDSFGDDGFSLLIDTKAVHVSKLQSVAYCYL